MRSDMRADRRAGRRADCRDPARIARLSVLLFLADRVGVERGHESEWTEDIDLRDRNFVSNAAEVGCDTIGRRRADAISHLDGVTMDRNLPIRVDFDGP